MVTVPRHAAAPRLIGIEGTRWIAFEVEEHELIFASAVRRELFSEVGIRPNFHGGVL
jgi:hypothetical protein